RGDFRVIGATTGEEYDRWIRGDPALERRFQIVQGRELDSGETIEILRSRVTTLERHHDVVIEESAVLAAVRLSDLFMPERRRPDRAIDMLDEACAHAHGAARLTVPSEPLARERRSRIAAGAAGHQSRRPESRDSDAAAAAGPEPRMFELGPDTQIELPEFAQHGISMLERFVAELGSLLDVSWANPGSSD